MALVVIAEHCSRCIYQQTLTRSFSTTQLHYGKYPKEFFKKERKLNTGYGIMVDTPDWSFADGRPAPPGTRSTTRREIQKQICARVVQLHSEINKATKSLNNQKKLRIKHLGLRREGRFKPSEASRN